VIAFEEAKKIVLDTAHVLDPEEKDILEAEGMTLAEDIQAGEPIPPFDNSAMDGYAVLSKDLSNASEKNPVSLKIIEDLPAGYVSDQKIEKGKAARIMTGAPVPQGADAVIMQEYTQESVEEEGHHVKVLRAVRKGENIRPKGEDIEKNEIILKAGKLLKPADIGVLASLGMTKVKVIRRPSIGILTTGNEVVEITEPLEGGKIRNSNMYSLLSLMHSYQTPAFDLGIAKDDAEEIKEKIKEGLGNDILLTVGGVSVGKYDLVHKVLEKLGMEKKFWKVAIKPGKPLLFGKLGKTIIFGLPGNTVSCVVGSELFVRPAIQKMCGRKPSDVHWVEAELTQKVKIKGERAVFFTANTEFHQGKYMAAPTPKQGSGKLSSLSSANSLIFIPKDKRETLEKEVVKVLLLDHWYEN
jgi:molybdopterin molybdotransferase